MLWALYLLVGLPIQHRQEAEKLYSEKFKECIRGPGETFKSCEDYANGVFRPGVDEWAIANYYRSLWPFILGGLTVVPAVVYGLIRGVAFLSLWIYRGFAT